MISIRFFVQTLQHSLSVDILPDAHVLGDTWEAKDLDIVSWYTHTLCQTVIRVSMTSDGMDSHAVI